MDTTDTTDATLGKTFKISCEAKMTSNPVDDRFLVEVNILSQKTEAESTTASTASTTTTTERDFPGTSSLSVPCLENENSEELEFPIENVPCEENRKEFSQRLVNDGHQTSDDNRLIQHLEQRGFKPRPGLFLIREEEVSPTFANDGIKKRRHLERRGLKAKQGLFLIREEWFDIAKWFLLLLAPFAVLVAVKDYLEEKPAPVPATYLQKALRMGLLQVQIEAFQKSFLLLDKNKDGEISAEEWRHFFQTFGENPTDAMVQDKINEFDRDGTGSLNLGEFLFMFAMQKENPDSYEMAQRAQREAFRMCDKDGDGFISPADYQHITSGLGYNLTDQEAKEGISKADYDGDNHCNYEEFKGLSAGNLPA